MDQETLIERLTAENEEFRRLRSEHQAHDQELEALRRTAPLCHPLRLTGVDVTFSDDLRRGELEVLARVSTVDKTGVEMEALTAVSVAALTVYDMIKAVEKGVTIARVQLVEKSGGKSGTWRRGGKGT